MYHDSQKCACDRTDCAANKGACIALVSTDFSEKKSCPFYKSKSQNDAECIAAIERVKGLNRRDILDNYYSQKANHYLAGLLSRVPD